MPTTQADETPAPQPESPATSRPPSGEEGWKLKPVVNHLAADMAGKSPKIPAGDQAALRRLKPGEAGGPSFWKIAVHYLEPKGLLSAASSPWRDAEERRWAAVLSAIAQLKDQHRQGFGLGHALAAADVTEARVLRLLRAHDDVLLDVLRAVVHQLRSKGQPVDLGDLAALVTSDGAPWEDSIRRTIAMDYYRRHRSENA